MGASGRRPSTPVTPPRAPAEPTAVTFVVAGPIAPDDVDGLCERGRRMLETSDAEVVVCDVEELVHPDALTVDALARLQLIAHRAGRRVQLCHACDELQELLSMIGLCDAVPLYDPSGLQPGGQAEHREQGGGVEEEVGPDDLPV